MQNGEFYSEEISVVDVPSAAVEKLHREKAASQSQS